MGYTIINAELAEGPGGNSYIIRSNCDINQTDLYMMHFVVFSWNTISRAFSLIQEHVFYNHVFFLYVIHNPAPVLWQTLNK